MTECGAVSTQIILGLDEDERSTVEELKEAPHKKSNYFVLAKIALVQAF